MTEAARLARDIATVRRVDFYLRMTLVGAAVGALTFTAVNVTHFALDHDVPGEIAWILDPMVSVVLLAVLVSEGLLARFGEKTGGWVTALKWTCGCAMWSMNIWAPVSAGHIPSTWLHSVPPLMTMLLAEATPRVRLKFAAVIERLEARLAATSEPDWSSAKQLREAADRDHDAAVQLSKRTLVVLGRATHRMVEAASALEVSRVPLRAAEVSQREWEGDAQIPTPSAARPSRSRATHPSAPSTSQDVLDRVRPYVERGDGWKRVIDGLSQEEPPIELSEWMAKKAVREVKQQMTKEAFQEAVGVTL